MPRVLALPGETFKDALITVDEDVWEQFKELANGRGMSASAEIRAFMKREVNRAKARGEL